MTVSIDSVSEVVSVAATPGYEETSVYSQIQFSDHRRHREEVQFRPVLHPVRYADTAVLYINNTRKRFVSRTFYEPRAKPRRFLETTFAQPKTLEQRYVTYLDIHPDDNRKWFKTTVQVTSKPPRFTSSQVLRSTNNNYILQSSAPMGDGIVDPNSQRIPNGFPPDDVSGYVNGVDVAAGGDKNTSNVSQQRQHDPHPEPGASQVYIPKRNPNRSACSRPQLRTGDDHNNFYENHLNGDENHLYSDSPDTDSSFLINGHATGFSDV